MPKGRLWIFSLMSTFWKFYRPCIMNFLLIQTDINDCVLKVSQMEIFDNIGSLVGHLKNANRPEPETYIYPIHVYVSGWTGICDIAEIVWESFNFSSSHFVALNFVLSFAYFRVQDIWSPDIIKFILLSLEQNIVVLFKEKDTYF